MNEIGESLLTKLNLYQTLCSYISTSYRIYSQQIQLSAQVSSFYFSATPFTYHPPVFCFLFQCIQIIIGFQFLKTAQTIKVAKCTGKLREVAPKGPALPFELLKIPQVYKTVFMIMYVIAQKRTFVRLLNTVETVFLMRLISGLLKHTFELLTSYANASRKGTNSKLPMPMNMERPIVNLTHSSFMLHTITPS